jgi:hypothetical protein
VYKNMFVGHLTYKALNSFQTTSLCKGCRSCLYICLYAKFEVLHTTKCLWVVHVLMFTVHHMNYAQKEMVLD